MQRIFLAGIVMLAAMLVSAPDTGKAQSSGWGEGYFPNPPVVTHDGKTVRFYDDLIKGRIVVISFIYTSCTDFCPLTTARMSQLEEKLGDLVGRDIFFYSITVDPENDTPEKLKDYAEAFGAGPGWRFVTGKPEDIRSILFKFGERRRSLTEHRNDIVLGNEATGEWSKDTLFGNLDRLVMVIRSMDPKWRDQVRIPGYDEASNTGLLFNSQPGQGLFKKICAPCHTIGVGDRVGPDLQGITARRERAWLSSYIRNPGKLRAQKDPVALALAVKYKAVHMPALGVTEVDATDLIAYLQSETSRLSEIQESAVEAHGAHDHSSPDHDHSGHQPHKH
jgi:cytochrome oxidase Cu insertion factor (SCO1/SenC/PrrC family)/mono/diheme cytochrome c family protein